MYTTNDKFLSILYGVLLIRDFQLEKKKKSTYLCNPNFI